MPLRAAVEPFEFWTRLTLTKLTGRRAADLAELAEHLRDYLLLFLAVDRPGESLIPLGG